MESFRTHALPILGLALLLLCAVRNAQPEEAATQEATETAALRAKAEQGDAEAQYSLGVMYDNGRGVPQDYAEAVKWYRLAAEQGHAEAQFNLGLMYECGLGVPQDYVRAHQWLSLAAATGDLGAKAFLDSVAQLMTPEQLAEAQRLVREWQEQHAKPPATP